MAELVGEVGEGGAFPLKPVFIERGGTAAIGTGDGEIVIGADPAPVEVRRGAGDGGEGVGGAA